MKRDDKLRLERWKSNQNEEELHYFLGARYVIGYNPKLISREGIELLLDTERVSLYVTPDPE
jgi:hypothetical protein